MTPHQPQQQDLRATLRSLWRWKFLVLALLIVVPAISYGVEARKTRQYRSTTLVQVQAVSIDPSIFPQGTIGGQGILTVARLVQTRTIAQAAGKFTHPPQPGASLLGKVGVTPDEDTGFLSITATDGDPARAADIANAFALAISRKRTETAVGQLNVAIAGLKRQLANVDRRDRLTQDQLRGQVQRLRAIRASQRPEAAIVERAVASSTPVGRNTRRAIELGLVIAVLLSIGAVALAENADRRVRSPDELEALTGLPLLSTIPVSAFASDGRDMRDEEAFQMLRGALTYFNVERQLNSVVISSPGQEDGKTTVAIRLALSLLRAGKHVILVDADLRHASIGPRLGVEASDGLGAVLVGERQLYEVLVTPQLDGVAETPEQGSLRVLPAGTPPPNPAELLSAPALRRVLTDLETRSDIVIVDTAAALAVSDALPLLQAASGVIMIARVNRSTRAAVRRLQTVITSASGTALGIVATGISPREHGYGYGYGYAQPSRRQRRAARKTAKHAPPTPALPPRDPVDV
jgi:capsular exopolysaccharide synthesis family protein